MSFTPFQINSVGGIPTPPTSVPATLAAGGTYDTGAMACGGYNKLGTAYKADQAGTLTLKRYIDAAGTIPIAADVTQAITANTNTYIVVDDGIPATSWRVTATNSSGSTANIAYFNLIVQV